MDQKKIKNSIIFGAFLFSICFLHSLLTVIELKVLLYHFYKNVMIFIFAPFIYLFLNKNREQARELDIKFFIFSFVIVLYIALRFLREGLPT
ncbi:MAG: hypothetical protein COB02_05475 [Candidatus Cloacimonadota bacterium]|nr:MAG: hypothetical protein COB02_05475 [Candidatus Cloacimonadota bacterium]